MPTTSDSKQPSKPDATVADVVAAAAETGAPTEVVVEVLRTRLRLGAVPVAHALGHEAAAYIRAGTKRDPAVVAAADQLWAAVPRNGELAVNLPDLDPSWETAAACRGKDPNLWFCDGEVCDDEIEAVSICASCPVVGHCAITYIAEQDGLWGGMTYRNRAKLRRYLRLGVATPTVNDIAPLAVEIALSSLRARIMSRPPTFTDDGRLFDHPVVESHPRRRYAAPRRRRAPVSEPLFA